MIESHTVCTAFQGTRLIASGDLKAVAKRAKAALDGSDAGEVLLFDDATGRVVEVDLRGTSEEAVARLMPSPGPEGPPAGSSEEEAPRRPGRPKLGVVAREVTLLPRHWEWLNGQPGGASVALRKLVEAARRASESRDGVRQAQEAAYRFMSTMAGNQPGYEEALRALFAGNRSQFEAMMTTWPVDIRDHARKLAAGAFPARPEADASA